MIKNIKVFLSSLSLIILFIVIFSISSANANPIPVYPNPDPVIFSSNSQNTNIPLFWIFLVFIIDFFIDILIVYSGIFIMDKDRLIKNKYVLDFSKTTFMLAVGLISIVGLISEFFFGQSAGGLIIVLLIILISFIFVSRYILKLNWKNSYRMGLYAIVINLIIWSVIFSI